jgi:hypothetical protein
MEGKFMWLKKAFVDFLCLKIIKISGVLYLLMVYYINFATGQAEIAYRYSQHAQLAGLIMLVIARFEESPFPLSTYLKWRGKPKEETK